MLNFQGYLAKFGTWVQTWEQIKSLENETVNIKQTAVINIFNQATMAEDQESIWNSKTDHTHLTGKVEILAIL